MKRLAPNAALLCFWIVLSIAAAEVAARALEGAAVRLETDQAEGPAFAPHPLLGWAPIPNARFSVRAGQGKAHESFNSLGLLGPETAAAKPAGSFRVLVLGDSMAAARQLTYDDRFVTRVERAIRERSATPIEFLNAARDGYQTDQEVLFYESEGSSLEPDLVLLAFFPANDVIGNVRSENETGTGPLPKPRFELKEDGQLILQPPSPRTMAPAASGPTPAGPVASDPVRSMLHEHSALYRLYRRARDSWDRLPYRCAIPDVHEVYRLSDSGRAREAWLLTRALFARLGAAAEAKGARLAIVLIPEELQVSSIAWAWSFDSCGYSTPEWSPDAPSRRFAAMCAELRLACLDLTASIRSERGPLSLLGSGGLFLPGDGHLSPAGHEVVATIVGKWLMSEGLIR